MSDQQTQAPDRKSYTAEQKFKIVKESLKTGLTISEIQKRYGVTSSNYYRWLDQFFEGALDRFRNGKDGPTTAELRKIEELSRDNEKMKNVIAEFAAENIVLKKTFGM
jgi:transposase